MIKIVLGSVISVLFTAGAAFAHPPSNIEISFDPAAKTVTAVITHEVKDAAKHFINKVDVGRNGKEIIAHSISRQSNNATQTVAYMIQEAQTGDVISVEGYCNISGKLQKEITVE